MPYFWGVMHALDNILCWMVVLMKGAQIGWTILVAADICKVAKTSPVNCLMLFPKEEKGKKFMEKKFVPLVESSPNIRQVIDTSTSRTSGNRATSKKFPGGGVDAVGSNSVSNVKSDSVTRGYVEEPDDTNKNVGDQGDSIKHLRERLKRKRDKKLIMGGTPDVEGLSQIQHYVKMGTMRVLPITCHDCGQQHILDWDNVSWQSKEHGKEHPIYGLAMPETAIYACPHCGSAWDDWQRKENILTTCRVARDAGDPFCGWVKTQCGENYTEDQPEPIETFYELSELYVCMDGTSLADVVRDYLEAEHEATFGDEGGRMVFQTNKLGRPYQYAANKILDHEKLQEQAEDYPLLTCPEGGLYVRAGVDVQHDRLAIIIRAWGRNEESWQMYWGEIDGDTADKTDPCYDALDALLFNGFDHERFGKIRLSGITIDSSDGATNHAVYHWVRTRTRKYPGVEIRAGKGRSDDYGDKEIYTAPIKVDLANNKRKPTKADKHGVKVFRVGTQKAKDLIAKRLLGTAAYMHSCANVRADYWEQVTAEVKAPTKTSRGKLVWQCRKGINNEGTDCEVYALHSAHAGGMHKFTPAKWDAIEQSLSQRTLFSEGTQNDDKKPAPKSTNKQPAIKTKGSWGSRL